MAGKQPMSYVAVIGGGEVSPEVAALAREVGRELARRGTVVICGGLGGVMEAAAQGVQEAGGVSFGILPDAGPAPGQSIPYLRHSHQPGPRPQYDYRPRRGRSHCHRRRLRHHLGGGHRPQTGENRWWPWRWTGSFQDSSGPPIPRRLSLWQAWVRDNILVAKNIFLSPLTLTLSPLSGEGINGRNFWQTL